MVLRNSISDAIATGAVDYKLTKIPAVFSP